MPLWSTQVQYIESPIKIKSEWDFSSRRREKEEKEGKKNSLLCIRKHMRAIKEIIEAVWAHMYVRKENKYKHLMNKLKLDRDNSSSHSLFWWTVRERVWNCIKKLIWMVLSKKERVSVFPPPSLIDLLSYRMNGVDYFFGQLNRGLIMWIFGEKFFKKS
jgi:hypothetical protein